MKQKRLIMMLAVLAAAGAAMAQGNGQAGIHLRPNRFTLGFLHGSVIFLRILRF